MNARVTSPVAELWTNFRSADPNAAVDTALATVADHDDPELRLALGQCLWGLGRYAEVSPQLEAAVRGFEELGQNRRAALAAGWLYCYWFEVIGNRSAGMGWLGRAERLLEGEPEGVEHGWVALALFSCTVTDADQLDRSAKAALELARRFGDRDLEAKALADCAVALIGLGRVSEGLGWIDQAMTFMMSAPVSPIAGAQICCALFTVCERTGDLARMESWRALFEEAGTMSPTGRWAAGYAHCDAQQGHLLTQLGQWSTAETVLQRGLELGSKLSYSVEVACRASLAELRIHQGQLDEAERLLVGHDDRLEAIIPLGKLHLARGDHDLAVAVAGRGLRLLGGDRVRAVELLSVLAEAELGRGRTPEAVAAAARLADVVAGTGIAGLAARAALVHARVREAEGDSGEATRILNEALGTLAQADVPMVRASIHLALARLQAASDPAAAAADARAAAAIHARLEAPLPVTATELFRDLGITEGLHAHLSSPRSASIGRQGDRWSVGLADRVTVIRDTKGLRYLAELLAHPGVERHVLDLVDGVEGTPNEPGVDRRRLGDAGEMLDGTAKAQYRRRLEELRHEMEAADAALDDDSMVGIQGEIDALVAELKRAVGLGGRDRRAASAAERARLNVTRAIRAAVGRIQEALPAAGSDLDRSVRTGLYCSYVPQPEGIAWSVSV